MKPYSNPRSGKKSLTKDGEEKDISLAALQRVIKFMHALTLVPNAFPTLLKHPTNLL
jgi:hypothetical protein